MKENKFITEIGNSFKHFGCYSYKISDSPTSWTMSKTRFTSTKPCDMFVNVDGKFVAVECKQIKKWEAFGLSKMQPGQVVALTNVIATGGRAFVFLNVRIKAIKGKQKHENRLIVFDWAELSQRLKESSIKAKELKELPYVEGFTHFRTKKSIFEFHGFINEIKNEDFFG